MNAGDRIVVKQDIVYAVRDAGVLVSTGLIARGSRWYVQRIEDEGGVGVMVFPALKKQGLVVSLRAGEFEPLEPLLTSHASNL